MNCSPIVRQYGILNNNWGVIFMPKGVPNKKYTPEFKKHVVETMREEGLSYNNISTKLTIITSGRFSKKRMPWPPTYIIV